MIKRGFVYVGTEQATVNRKHWIQYTLIIIRLAISHQLHPRDLIDGQFNAFMM